MVVLTRRTFKFTVRRKTVFWAMGITAGICAVAFIGSWYGFWATKKIMSFTNLEKETREQQEQLRESRDQAEDLRIQIDMLRGKFDEMMGRSTSASEQSETSDASNVAGSSEKMGELKNALNQADDLLKRLRAQVDPVLDKWEYTPAVLPTTGTITSPYGARIHPFSRGGGDDRWFDHHSGIDFSNATGTPIQATANGKVTFANWQGNYGLMVTIRHSDEFETVYAHLHRNYVLVGQEVERGHVIGTMGQTGRATGPHLHYEVRQYGKAVNPSPYLNLQAKRLAGLKK
jgi:murein DD-endopeptidase MepM/ murein hydrolase activator NlpD